MEASKTKLLLLPRGYAMHVVLLRRGDGGVPSSSVRAV